MNDLLTGKHHTRVVVNHTKYDHFNEGGIDAFMIN